MQYSQMPNNGARPRKRRGHVLLPLDFCIHLTIILTALGISRIPLIPFGPHVVMVFLTFGLLIGTEGVASLKRVARVPELVTLLFCVIISTFYDYGFDPATDLRSAVGALGRNIGMILLLAMIPIYTRSYPERLFQVWRTIWIMFALSCAWFICEVFIGEPFIGLRERMYPFVFTEALGIGLDADATLRRCCFSPNPFIVGYHVATLSCLALPLVIFPSYWLYKLAAIPCFILSFVGAALSSQRSALLSFGIALLWLTSISRRFLGLTMLLVVMGVGGYVALYSREAGDSETYDRLQKPLWEKISDPDHWLEVNERLGLQTKGVEILFTYPFGLLSENLQYEDVNREALVSVHNHYLSRGTRYGLLYTLLLVVFLVNALRRALRVIRGYCKVKGAVRVCMLGASFALLGLLIPCAMTHHGGIVSNDAATVLMLALVLAGDLNSKLSQNDLMRKSY